MSSQSKKTNSKKRKLEEIDDSILEINLLESNNDIELSKPPPQKKSKSNSKDDGPNSSIQNMKECSSTSENKGIFSINPVKDKSTKKTKNETSKKSVLSKNSKKSVQNETSKNHTSKPIPKKIQKKLNEMDLEMFEESTPLNEILQNNDKKIIDVVLSYDVGIINLAEAVLVFYEDKSFEVKHLKQINLLEENHSKAKNSKHFTTEKLTTFMIKYLYKNSVPLIQKFKPNKVLIERQPGLNRKITTLAFVLKSFYYLYFLQNNKGEAEGEFPDIRFKDPKLKLSVYASHFLQPDSYQIEESTEASTTAKLINQQILPETISKNRFEIEPPKKKEKMDTKKLKKLIRSKYRENKKHAMKEVDLLMDSYQGCHQWKRYYYQMGAKRDDLADCILQACQEHDLRIKKRIKKHVVEELQDTDESEDEQNKSE